MNKKYELLKDDVVLLKPGTILCRIRALERIDGPNVVVEVGELGGYIEKESNLDIFRTAWIDTKAYVYGDAKIKKGAYIGGEARVYGEAVVTDCARIIGSAEVYGNAVIGGETLVTDMAEVHGLAVIGGASRVTHMAEVSGNATVFNGIIKHYASVKEEAHVSDGGIVDGWQKIAGRTVVYKV